MILVCMQRIQLCTLTRKVQEAQMHVRWSQVPGLQQTEGLGLEPDTLILCGSQNEYASCLSMLYGRQQIWKLGIKLAML